MSSKHQGPERRSRPRQTQLLGGAVIDAQGQEIPITEDMVQRACRELDPQRVEKGHPKPDPKP